MNPSFNSLYAHSSRRRGFALLITITLLAFLVLLLVSLASLTRVETQVASNSQQLAKARQNALMALNIAIGQLQRTLGPDQRTTARADMADPNNVNGFTTLPKAGATRWTSAWGNANAGDYTLKPSQVEAQVDPATGSVNKPRLLSWLVSGNESDAFSANSNGAITTASNTPKFNPGLAVTGLNTTTTALTPLTLPVANPVAGTSTTGAVLLVGPNSVSSTNETYTVTTTSGSTYTGSDYVAAPLVDIQAAAGTVPGQTAATTIGRYAYWVGDEGIKARANLVDNYLQMSSPAIQTALTGRGLTPSSVQDATKPYSSFIAQHSGISFMDAGPGTSSYTANLNAQYSLIGTDYNYNNYNAASASINLTTNIDSNHPNPYTSSLYSIFTSQQIPFLPYINPAISSSSAINASATRLTSALQNRFHDISNYSFGVLADSYAGGLKKDISAVITPGWSATGPTSDTNTLFTPETTGPGGNPPPGVPTWGHLRSYSNYRPNAAHNLPVQMPTPTNTGMTMNIVYAAFGFKLYHESDGTVYMALYPLLGLYNYNTSAIDIPTGSNSTPNAKFGFSIRQRGALTFSVTATDPTTGATTALTSSPIDAKDLAGAGSDYFIFPLKIGSHGAGSGPTISLATPGGDYAPNSNVMQQPGTQQQAFNYARVNLSGPPFNIPKLTAAQMVSTNPPAPAAPVVYTYNITVGGTGGDMDVVFAGKTAALSGYTRPVPSSVNDTSGWYHCIQHVRFFAPNNPSVNHTITATPLSGPPNPNGTPADMPDTVMRTQAVMSGVAGRTSYNNFNIGMDPNYQLRFWAQGNMRAPLSAPTTKEFYTASSGYDNGGNGVYGGICVPNTNPITNSVPGQRGNYATYVAFEGGGGGGAANPTASPPVAATNSTVPNSFPMGFYFRKGGVTKLFGIARDDIPLLSLGFLQNANISLIDTYPTWALGNSLANFRIPGNKVHISNAIEQPGDTTNAKITNPSYDYYDISWLLNHSLWDKYFVSTVPSGPAGLSSSPSSPPPASPWKWTQADIDQNIPVPNARMTYFKQGTGTPVLGNLENTGSASNYAFDQAAANLMVAGGFNINSTSEQAWRALFGGTASVPYRYYSVGTGSYGSVNTTTNDNWASAHDVTTPYTNAPVGRTVSPPDNVSAFQIAPVGGNFFSYLGNRNLAPSKGIADSPADSDWSNANAALPQVIAKLAHDTVTQIKIRGPFLSMGDFINRRLIDDSTVSASDNPLTSNSSSTLLGNTGLKGTLQAALDTDTYATATITNNGNTVNAYPISVNPLWIEKADDDLQKSITTALLPQSSSIVQSYGPQYVNHMRGSTYDNPNPLLETFQWRYGSGSQSTVTQADLLATFGSGLLARSDTFTIRTYGEVINPATQAVEGRAWCEAVVQRLPSYIDPTDSSLKNSSLPQPAGGATATSVIDNSVSPNNTNKTNQTFGRRFKIISFRWLTSNDI